jgi:uncharacterized protein YdbL (DUF1318 family)
MMKNKMIVIISLVLACFLINTSFAFAGAAEIKARMKERLPLIDQLKAGGIVGEDNKGYLQFRGKKEKEDVVNAENSDRRKVYEAIAAQQGSTPEHVGKRRAIQIADIAKPGEWLQDESGNWYQK